MALKRLNCSTSVQEIRENMGEKHAAVPSSTARAQAMITPQSNSGLPVRKQRNMGMATEGQHPRIVCLKNFVGAESSLAIERNAPLFLSLQISEKRSFHPLFDGAWDRGHEISQGYTCPS